MIYSNIYNTDGEIIRPPIYEGTLTDSACRSKFLELMNAKASALGMTGTVYVSPSGLTTSNKSTAQDALKLGVAVCGNAEALRIWHTPSQNFNVYGQNARTISVTNNVIARSATDLTPYYRLLGGKGGSLAYSGDAYYRAQILAVEINNMPVILSVMAIGKTAYDNIYKSCKELADMVKDTLDGNTPTEGANLSALVTAGGGYAGCAVPNIPVAYDLDYASALFASRANVVKNGETEECIPASTTKTITMLCALDYITDYNATIQLVSGDIEGGSGTTFSAGDILSIGDALKIMMMESSNTLAQAIGRTIGGRALQLSA